MRSTGFRVLAFFKGSVDIKESPCSTPSESQADREVFYLFLGAQLVPVQGRMCPGCSESSCLCTLTPPREQTEDASVLLAFIYHSCCPWRGPWERDGVMVGRNQVQKQCLYVGQPEFILGVLSLPSALWRQSGVPGAAVPLSLLRAGPAREGWSSSNYRQM